MKKQHCVSQQHFSIYTICFGNNLIYTVLLLEVEIHAHTPLKRKINERKKRRNEEKVDYKKFLFLCVQKNSNYSPLLVCCILYAQK